MIRDDVEEQDSPRKHYKHDALPESITRNLFVTYGTGKYTAGRISITEFEGSGRDGFETVELCTATITVDIPREQDIKAKCLEVLEEEKSRVMAENHQRLKAVQEKIDQLLAIEYQPGA